MQLRRARSSRPPTSPTSSPPPEGAGPPPPRQPWTHRLDDDERPRREDLLADHNPFESLLSPVPLPRWLRGRRRQRDR